MTTQQDSPSTPPPDADAAAPVLAVRDLVTTITSRRSTINPVDHVSFDLARGEILALVGESGCGKSMTALTIMRLLPTTARVSAGEILLDGRDLLTLKAGEMRRVRGRDIAMVFQEPMTSLDPSFTIGSQIAEGIHAHERVSGRAALDRATDLLDRVQVPNARARLNDYPHQFSGGMRQRVMLAMALALQPKVLLADEPTTALDVTTQAQFLDLIVSLQREFGMSVILITHDLGVVNEIADRVAVMYAGQIVELNHARALFDTPEHPYTQGLMRSMPGLAERGRRLHTIDGRVAEFGNLPPACRFAPRCPNRIDICEATPPTLEGMGPSHGLRCYNPTPFHA